MNSTLTTLNRDVYMTVDFRLSTAKRAFLEFAHAISPEGALLTPLLQASGYRLNMAC
ncbi:TPA: hypothetical protein ACHWKL_004123 [Providencia stuartii]|uniref:hypothetical protein n=1 Tax=Providencia manganoxydans TaxID=2923283 RepID=UPI0034E4D935